MEGLNYNTSRGDLQIPEYGRNIKNMINYAISIEDREERQKIADAIISVMGQLNPHLRDITDFTHKLWDHLFIISDYKLDVDSPYPIPEMGEAEKKPELLHYSEGKRKIRYAYYGKSVSLFIKEAINKTDPKEKELITLAVANLMKKLFLTWNKDYVEDFVILGHLEELSKGNLTLPKDTVLTSVEELSKSIDRQSNSSIKKKTSKKNTNSRKKYTKK